MGRVSLRLVVATVFLSFALLFTGVAVFVTQMTGAQSSIPTISFHEITAVREGETAMIMVSVSEPLRTPLPLTLNLVREGSTATRNEDYTFRPGGVKIERGETMAVITVPTLDGGDNSYYEGDETVVLELRVNENRVQFNTPDVRTLTIEDMLPAPTLKLNFEGPTQEGLDKDFTVNLSHAADVTVTVSVAARSSSRAKTADYTISPSTFEIAARELTATFTLETVPDGIYEFTETLILEPRASIAAMALKSAPAGGATVVIAESDPIPTVSVSDDVEIDEDTGVVEFTVDLSGALDTTVTLSLRVNDRSTADSDDYDQLPATFEIAPRATSFTFMLEITLDEVYELSETLEFDLSFMALELNLGTFSRVVTIRNDEELPEVSLDAVESLNEGDRHELTVSLSGVLQSTATVTLIEQRGGVDYTLSPATVMVPPGVTVTVFTLDVSDDTLYQGRSRELEFIPILDSSPLGLSGVTGDGVVITVLDNDLPPVVMFDPIPDVSKGESGVTTARFAQATQRVGLSDTVGVDLSIIGATEIPEGETVTIGIELDQPLTQSLADDLVINTSYEENVFAGSNFEDITSVAGVRAFSTVSGSEAYTETLGFAFQFYTETYNTIAVHTNGFIGFTDDPDDLLNSTGDIDGYRDDNTPAVEGKVVPIVAPLLSTINYRNPGIDPTPAFYGVRLGAGTAEDRYIVQYTNARVRVDIGVRVLATFQVALYANGRIELRYQDIPSSVQEAAKIGISNGEGTNMHEEFSYLESKLSDDTRIVYTPPSVNIAIKDADGETVTSFDFFDIIAVDGVRGTIQLVNRTREDINWDGDQAYTAELIYTSPLIVFTGTVVSYTFTDDDQPEVALEYDMCTTVCDRAEVAEGDSLTLVVRLTNVAPTGAPEAVTVNLEIQGGTATEFSDYTLPDSVTIAEGASQTILVFSTSDDSLAEGTEELTIGFSSVEYGDSRLQSSVRFELLIIDNEEPAQITVNPISPVSEGETIVVEVVLITISAEDVTVTLDVATTSDAEPTDYTLPESLIATIASGDTTAIFQIATTGNDDLYEGTEMIDLEFTALDGTVAATAFIRDRDKVPTVAFEASRPVTVAEGSTVTLLVALNDTLAEPDIVVDVMVSGTADEGVDYSSLGRSVTIPSGETSTIISIFATDDQLTEGAETFELRLLSASSGVNVATPNVVDVTIMDDDIVTIGFALNSSYVAENSGLQEIEIEVKGGTLAEALNVAVATVAGTATAPDDYADTRQEIVLSATDTRGSISIPIELDSLIEGTESFEVVLSLPENSPLSDGVVFDPMTATVTIIDTDSLPTLRISPVGEVTEGHSTTIEVYLNRSLGVPVSVSLAYGIGSTASQNDYTLSEIDAKIAAGELTATFSLDADQNRFYEIDEQLILVPSGSVPGLGEIMVEPGVVTIVDDETQPTLELDRIDDIRESTAAFPDHSIFVRLTGDPLEADLSYDLGFGGKAVMDEHYIKPFSEDLIRAGEQFGAFIIRVGNNQDKNEPKSVVISVTVDEASRYLVEQGFVKLGILTRSFFILDIGLNSPLLSLEPVVDVEDSSVGRPGTILQGSSGIIAVDLDNTLDDPLTATLKIIPTDTPGTTVPAGPDDYRLSYLTDTGRTYTAALEIPFTIPANAREFTFTLEAIDRMNVRHDPDKTLLLELSADTGTVDLGVTQRGVTIRDYDPAPILSFEETDYSVDEGQSLTFTVEVVGAASYTQTLSLDLNLPQARPRGTDRATDRDLSLSPTGVITIPVDSDGSSPISKFEFTLTAKEDNFYEGPEAAALNIILQDDSGNLVAEDIRDVNIIDNELFPTLSLDMIEDVTEGGAFTVTVRISSALETPFLIRRVDYVPAGSTAERDDYKVSGSFPLGRIDSGKTTAEIISSYQVNLDGIYEGTETLRLRPFGESERLILEGEVSEIAIRDADTRPTVSLDAPGQVDEGDSITVTVRLDGVLESPVTVELVPTNGNAESDDYTISPTRVTILPGATVAKFTLDAHPDIIPTFETTETLTLDPVAIIVEGSVRLATDSSVPHQVAISENLPVPPLAFRPGEIGQFVNEGESLTFTVELMGLASETHTLTLIPNLGGSGNADTNDLSFSPTSFTIPVDRDGSSLISQFEFIINTNQDNIYEETESVKFELVLQDDNGVEKDRLNAVIDLIDDEPIPTLSLGPIMDVTEGGVFTVTVRLSGPVKTQLIIDELRYVSVGSTAEMDDYVVPGSLSGGEIRIAAGMTTAVVAFQTRLDEVYEGAETLVLRPRATGAGLELGGSSGEVTIIDDEQIPTVSLDAPGQVAEGDIITVTVRLDGVLESTVTVELLPTNGNAESDDYTISPARVTILPGATVAKFTLTAHPDIIPTFETTETLTLNPVAIIVEGSVSLPTDSSVPHRVAISESLPVPFVVLQELKNFILNEGQQGVQIKALLQHLTEFTVTVSLSRGAGSTAEEEDYELETSTLEIGAGKEGVLFTLDITPDDLYEGDEELVLEGRATGNGLELPIPNPVVMIIDDEQLPTLSLDQKVASIDEGIGVTLTVTLDGALEVPVTVSLLTGATSTAKANDDYTLSPLTFRIESGQLTATFRLNTLSDKIYEGNEQLVLVPRATGDGIDLRAQPFATTITDENDRPNLQIGPAGEVIEGHSTTIEVSLTSILNVPVRVSLAYGVGSTASQSDYTLSEIDAEIAAGKLTATFSLEAVQNELYELTETLILVPSASGVGLEDITGEPGVITIVDDEAPPTLSFEPLNDLDEGDIGMITVRLNGVALETPLVVTVTVNTVASRINDISPVISPDEYQLIPVVSVIPAGELTATFRLETYHDGRFRGDRTLEIDLVTDNDQVVLAGGPIQVELMELDMVPVLSLDPIPDVLDTRGSFLIEINLSNLLDNDLDLELTTGLVEGSYIAFLRLIDPVEQGRVAVTGIPAGLQTGLITFRPQNVASDQTVTLALQLDDDAIKNADLNELEALGLIELGVTSRTFRILDRDVKPVLSLDPVGTIAEGSTNEVTVRLDRPLISDLTVSLTIDSAATLALDRPAEEGDYELPSTSFVIPASALLTTFSLKSIDDDIYEGDEQFVLRLEHEPIYTDQFDLGQDTQIVTIRDGDPPELILDEVVSPVNEGDSFNLTGQLRGARVLPITLSLNTSSAASTVGSDEWSVTPQTITVPAGNQTYPFSFTVTVKEDSVYEGTERAVFEVTAVGASERVLNRESFGLVEINDNDTIPEISRITIPEGVTEGETFRVVVELNDALGTYLDVSLVHDGASTAEQDDYQITPPIYRIEAGQTIATLEVEIFDDRLYELMETLVFSITASNTEARIELPMLSRSIEITESEELPRIVLRAIDDPITEGGDGVTVTVRVNGAFEVPLTLSLTTAVTSLAGTDDYSLSRESIVIPASYKQENVRDNGRVRVDVEFRLTADTDDLYEGPEEIILDLIVDTSADPRIDLTRGTFRRATTIMDVNRPPTLVLDGPTEINEGESAEYTLSLTGALGVSLTVSFAPGAATTADPPDYRLPGSEIVILSGNTVAVFTLETVPDDLYEGNEQLELVLSFSGAPVEFPEIKQTITIREPRPTVSLEPSSPSVNEGDGVTVTAVLNGGFTEDVDVLLEIVGGTADVADYVTPSTLRATITAGNTRFAFVITATTDGVYDGLEPETLELGLSVFGQGTPITAAVQTLTITDLETLPTLSLELPPRTVRETDGTLLLTATLSVGLDEDVELSLSVGGDVGEGDYSVAQQLTISAGDVSGTFEFVIKDDRIYEGTEAVELTLNGETTGAVVETLLPFSAEFAIVDDEGPVTIMVISPPSVLEDEEIVIEVELTAIALEDVTVTLVIAETGNAKPADYQLLDPLTRTIGAGDMETTFRIRAESDNLYEGIETIDLQFHALGGIVESTLNIIDANEPPAVRIASAQPTTVTEGASVEILVELDGVLSERDVVVDFTVSGTAVEGTDYTVPGRSVTIPSSRRTAAITLVATDDTVVYSGDASRTVELELTGASGGVTLGDSLTHTVTIIDDDVPVVPDPPGVEVVTATISPESVTLSEGASVSLEIVLESAASVDVTLTLVLENESDGVTASDYSLTPTAVFISAGMTSAMVLLTASDDPDLEAEEQFDLRLVSASSGVTVAVGRVVMVTIEASDQPMIAPGVEVVTATISPESVTLSEGASVSLEIVLESAVSVDVTLTLVLENESDGVTASDYSLTPTAVFISAGMTSAMVLLTASDDPDLEAEEQFDLRLVSASSGVTVAVGRVVMVTIEASDQPMIAPGVEVVTATISPESVTLSEGASVSLEIVLESAVSVDVTLTLVLENESDGVTASDYSLTPTAVFISAGMTSAMVLLTASDDPDLEAEEQFDLRLVSVSSGVTVAARRVVPVTILENDRPPVVMLEATDVEFVVTSALIDEGEEYEIELRLVDSNRNPLSHSQDIEVTLEVVNTIATTLSTDEYLLDGERRLSTMVNIPANEITGTVLFQSVEDNADEPDEHITLRISAADQVSWQIGRTLRINVRDDDDPVQDVTATLSVSTLDIREDEQQTILVKLSEAPASTVTVELTRLSGSAGTDDYSLSPRLLTFTPSGSLELSALISGVLDSLYEGPEDVVFELSVLSGPAVVGVTDTVTVTIADGDTAPTVSFDIADSTVDEGDTANVVVMLSGRSQDAVTVNFMVSGSAMVGADYTTPGTSVTIPANSDSTMITFAIKDESRYDGVTETVILTLTSATGYVTVGATNVHTLTIDDRQNRPTLSLDPVAAVAEGGTRNVVARLSGALDENVIVTLTATPGTAGTDDYSLVQTSVTILSGTLEATFMVSATDDDVYEGNEDLTLSASAPGVTGTPSRDLTIMEMAGETAPTLSLGTVTTVDEGTAIEIVVNLSGAYTTDIEVTLELLSGGTATESEDYMRPSQLSMMISAGSTMATFRIVTVD